MKNKIYLLPCIAAVAIATVVGTKTFKSNSDESNELLMANVEALTSAENGNSRKWLKQVSCTCLAHLIINK